MTDSSLSKLIEEAEALLTNASDYAKRPMLVGHVEECEIYNFRSIAPVDTAPVAYLPDLADARLFARAPALITSLIDALKEQVELNETQAQSIREFQTEQKIMRAAINTALRHLEGRSLRTTEQAVEQVRDLLLDAITPKGETKS